MMELVDMKLCLCRGTGYFVVGLQAGGYMCNLQTGMGSGFKWPGEKFYSTDMRSV